MANDTRRTQEEQHIANLERLGWTHNYTYNPDGNARRHCFSDPGGTGVVFRGLRELRAADYAAFGQAKGT